MLFRARNPLLLYSTKREEERQQGFKVSISDGDCTEMKVMYLNSTAHPCIGWENTRIYLNVVKVSS